MIRALLVSNETIPDSLLRLSNSSDEVQVFTECSAPDVLLIYVSRWNRASLMDTKQVLSQTPQPALIVCVHKEEPFSTNTVLGKDIAGVLPLNATKDQMILGLRAAAAGLRVLHDPANNKKDLEETVPLTRRELEILKLIVDGEGNKSIAYLLGISEHTVKFHISSIFEKLGVSSRTEAVKAGITRGLVFI